MKALIPWCCLLVASNAQVAFANQGLDSYRQGQYDKAAKALEAQGSGEYRDFYLGQLRLYGYGLLKDNAQAMSHFKNAAEKGFLPAQNIMARYSLLQENNPQKALEWFKKAAAQGDIDAQMYTAAAYLYGVGTDKSAYRARQYFIDAAKNGNSIAQYTLAKYFLKSRHSKDRNLGLIWLNKSVAQNNPAAMLKLGQLYLKGKEVKKDIGKAREYITAAVEQGYVPAITSLGDLALEENNTLEAKRWYTKAAEKNDVTAQVDLAELYLQKKNDFYSPQQGFLWLLKAAQNQSKTAQLKLAKLYEEGKVLARNDHLAKEWQEKAKKNKKDHKAAVVKAAMWLSNGKKTNLADCGYQLGGIFTTWTNPNALVENNYNLAPEMEFMTRNKLFSPQFEMVNPKNIPLSEFYNVLVESMAPSRTADIVFPHYSVQQVTMVQPHAPLVANSPALKNIAYDFKPMPAPSFNGSDFLMSVLNEEKTRDDTAYERLFRQAILGNTDAQFKLGQMYENGIGVHRNAEKAIEFYTMAALQNYLPAEYSLGVLYLKGEGIPPDYGLALDWLQEAAFEGNAYAQYALAQIFEKGFKDQNGNEIILASPNFALSMYYLASANEYGPAQYQLAEILVRQKQQALSVNARHQRNQLVKRLYEGAASQGVKDAILPLAFYNATDSDPEKQEKALAAARKAAGEGNADASLLLGILYDRGIAVNQNQAEAVYWYQQASKNPVSAFILGTYYSRGEGLNQDRQQGQRLLQQSADAGFSYANLNLAVINQQLGKPFLPQLEKAHQAGNPTAGLLLADYYLSQASNPQQMQQAKDIYEALAEKGDKKAQLKLGYMYEQGLGGKKDYLKAQHWYTLAANQHDVLAQYQLGNLYQMGYLSEKPDYVQAKQWYGKIQQTYPPAAVALGFIDETVDENYQTAQQAYQVAANKNDVSALYNLGLIYEKGKGRAVDFQKAQQLYLQAAKQNHAKAMVQLAGMYFNGNVGSRNPQQALDWYKKAAALGEREALYQLGLLSETGVGTKLDYPKARQYYEQAAAKGNAKAILALARMYQYGLGVKQNKEKALELYKELASIHNSFAQFQLASLYYQGIAGENMVKEGKRLLEQAQQNGSQQAQKALLWINSQNQARLSFIEPVLFHPVTSAHKAADLMYLEALNEWNRGDERISRMILDKIMVDYPHYVPAKRAYEQLYQPFSLNIFG